MTRARLTVLAAALAAAVAAPRAVAELGRDPLPSAVIFPPQQLPLSFSHALHLGRERMGCDFCHDDAAASRSAADDLMPGEAACAICHPIDRADPGKQVPAGKPGARCTLCHPGWDGQGQPPRLVVPKPNLKFSHELHVSRQIRCKSCHGDLRAKGVGLATRAQLPRMSLCLDCHDGKKAAARCTTCHLGESGGLVRTAYPQGALVPSGALHGDAHDALFRTDHARVAASDEAYCGNCHRRDFCVDCHDGAQKPLDFHGNDYVALHPIDARRNDPDCSACHRRQTFCTGCHSRTGVGTDLESSEFVRGSADPGSSRNFHPEGWFTSLVPGAREKNHHSFDAQRNIRTCASCHREEFCLDCHSGGLVDPHPAGWRGSARCEALLERSGRMCLKCHLDATEAQCD